jgi:hypothetical protein
MMKEAVNKTWEKAKDESPSGKLEQIRNTEKLLKKEIFVVNPWLSRN